LAVHVFAVFAVFAITATVLPLKLWILQTPQCF